MKCGWCNGTGHFSVLNEWVSVTVRTDVTCERCFGKGTVRNSKQTSPDRMKIVNVYRKLNSEA